MSQTLFKVVILIIAINMGKTGKLPRQGNTSPESPLAGAGAALRQERAAGLVKAVVLSGYT